MDIIDQMNAAFQSGQVIFRSGSIGKLLVRAFELRARMAEAIADGKRDADKIAQLKEALEKAHDDDVRHVVTWRMALRKTVDALVIFTDPEHGEITRRDWEQIIKAESHAREMLR